MVKWAKLVYPKLPKSDFVSIYLPEICNYCSAHKPGEPISTNWVDCSFQSAKEEKRCSPICCCIHVSLSRPAVLNMQQKKFWNEPGQDKDEWKAMSLHSRKMANAGTLCAAYYNKNGQCVKQ